MTFREAIAEIRAGGKVCRPSWPTIHRLECSTPRRIFDFVFDPGMRPMMCTPCTSAVWNPSVEDYNASDWKLWTGYNQSER